MQFREITTQLGNINLQFENMSVELGQLIQLSRGKNFFASVLCNKRVSTGFLTP